MDKRQRIMRFITPQQQGIEIGPFFAPMAPKRMGYNCLVVDVFDTATLRRRAAEDPHIPDDLIDRIEEVDITGSSSAIGELVAAKHQLGTFDYIISSHNFEHLPDPVRFLQGCGKVLRPGGVLSMVLPDRRTCFDYFRPHSTLAGFLDAYYDARDRPTPAQVFESGALRCRYGNGSEIFSLDDDPANVVPITFLAGAYGQWEYLRNNPDAYLDIHCWTFTPASFELIIRDLIFLGMISWDVVEISGTIGCEFFVHLQNRSEGEVGELPAELFYEQRRDLLHRVSDENGLNSRRSYQQKHGQREARRRASELQAELDAMRNSTSWRITAPLRSVSAALRRPFFRASAPRLKGPAN
jgi:SAM-dependent methyltransferase